MARERQTLSENQGGKTISKTRKQHIAELKTVHCHNLHIHTRLLILKVFVQIFFLSKRFLPPLSFSLKAKCFQFHEFVGETGINIHRICIIFVECLFCPRHFF